MVQTRANMLPPTLRKNSRYIIFNAEEVDFSTVNQTIWDTCLEEVGEVETALLDMWIVKDLWNENQHVGGVRVTSEKVAVMENVLNACGYDILGVAGTMKSARRQFPVHPA